MIIRVIVEKNGNCLVNSPIKPASVLDVIDHFNRAGFSGFSTTVDEYGVALIKL